MMANEANKEYSNSDLNQWGKVFWITLFTVKLVSYTFSQECKTIIDVERSGLYRLTCSSVRSLPLGKIYDPRIRAVLITSSTIESLPSYSFFNFPYVESIHLSSCNVKNIVQRAFHGLIKLGQLYINHNYIRYIKKGALDFLVNLRILDLSHNSINAIEKDAMEGLTSLKYAFITGNNLKDIDFLFRLFTLEHVDVSMNKIAFLRPNTFDGLYQLTYLNISYNEINYISLGTFKHLRNLRSLDISHNKLILITLGSLSGLNALTNLDLSHNKLKTVTTESYHMLEHLQYWKIDYNEITEFETIPLLSFLTNLKKVELNGNNWTCSVLLGILSDFRKFNIGLKPGWEYDKYNINGIACQPTIISRKVDLLENFQYNQLIKIVNVVDGINRRFERILNQLSHIDSIFNYISNKNQ